MKIWWGRLPIKNKLQLPIQLALLLVMTVVQRTAMDAYENSVLDEAKGRAVVSADGLLNGLNMLMVNGIISQADQRELMVKKMGASSGVLELRVIRNKPVQDQFGPGLPSEQAVDEMDRRALQTAKVQTDLLQKDGKNTLRVVVPFIARQEFRGTRCLMCHNVPDGTVNGAGSVTLDLTGEYAQIYRANYVMWGVQLVIQTLLYFMIGWLIRKVTAPTHELQRAMQTMQRDGDLSGRVMMCGEDEIGKTSQSFNELAQRFQTIVSRVGENAGKVAGAAHSLAGDAAQISQSSQQQSDAACHTATAVGEMRVSIAQIAETTRDVARLSNESLERAIYGQGSSQEMMQQLGNVERAVNEIATVVSKFVSNTQRISNMTQQVRDIAEQTNLLALNAAIEAARAGEQGRGFAVVADEVRKLAEKSAQSATQIDDVTRSLGEQSGQVEETVQRGMSALQSSQTHIREVSNVLVEANALVRSVNQGMETIAGSINQQRDSSHEIAGNVDRIAEMASKSNEAVKRAADGIKTMELLAEELSKTVGQFKV
ncbi:MAG: methyl-accepting chemotaxis protein [Gallionella sp.]|jgi:methyl-accepting chemotaxis protein